MKEEDKGERREHRLGEVIDRLVKRLDELEVETRSIRDALKEVGRGIEKKRKNLLVGKTVLGGLGITL